MYKPEIAQIAEALNEKFGGAILSQEQSYDFTVIVVDKKELVNIAFKQIKSLDPLEKMVKVRINHLGAVVHVGEY